MGDESICTPLTSAHRSFAALCVASFSIWISSAVRRFNLRARSLGAKESAATPKPYCLTSPAISGLGPMATASRA